MLACNHPHLQSPTPAITHTCNHPHLQSPTPAITHSSIQDELGRETGAEIGTVAASYAAMLLYIAVSLGGLPSRLTRPLPRRLARVCVLR